MNTTSLLLAAAITLPVVGLIGGWLWITVKQIERQFLAGFEGMHFEF